MADVRKIINKEKALIGMVHLHALPGTPKSKKTPQQIIDTAISEANTLVEYGFELRGLGRCRAAPRLDAIRAARRETG